PDSVALNIFVFGSSTTLGPGVEDGRTAPAVLQAILREKTKSGEPAVNVYNFGSPSSFSSQEVAWFQNQLRNGHRPEVAVFLDGANDFHFWDGDPAQAKSNRIMRDLLFTQNRQLGRERGVAWHIAELWTSLPMVKVFGRAPSSPIQEAPNPQGEVFPPTS